MFNKTKNTRILRTIEFIVLDAFSIFSAYALTIGILFLAGFTLNYNDIFFILPIVILFKIIIFYFNGFYSLILKHLAFEDTLYLGVVIILTNVILFIFLLFFDELLIHPMMLFIIGMFELLFIVGLRMSRRLYTVIFKRRYLEDAKEVIIVGAGAAGDLIVREIYGNNSLNYKPLAFVDDDRDKIGKKMLGLKILGPINEINQFIKRYDVSEVIIAIADMNTKELKRIVDLITVKNVLIKRIPLMKEMPDADKQKTLVDVKVEDLLNRDTVNLDAEEISAFIKNEIVLVTGGGGSIGSELCRQIALHKPKKLIIFDIYENNAYEIQMELLRQYAKSHKSLDLEVFIGSVYNYERLEQLFKVLKPTLVFHAAAYKHVPLMEDSPEEAVRTNVLGTYNTAKLANKYGVKNFVLVSSDKAVRPTNVMGATKRFAELIMQKFNKESTVTKFSAVRFGNVLGSNGSVIPLFRKQIEDGGPITVTHEDITRYFMTIPEAVGLILQSAVFAEGGEIFILDMGEPVKIKDLAEKMIRLSGLTPYEDIDIIYTGLRPGEKLYEELLVENTTDIIKTDNDLIFIECKDCFNGETLTNDDFLNFINDIESYDTLSIKSEIKAFIKSYKESSE